jgi:hypothetical protein
MARAGLWLLWLAACEPHKAPASPAEPGPVTALEHPTPRPRPAVRSCPATDKPRPVTIDPRLMLGEAAGVTWIFGYAAGDAVLAHLGLDGGLALTRVPLHNAQVGAVADARIWLYAPRESEAVPTRWTTIDVRDPDAPITGPVVPVKVGAKLDYADTLAVGSRRALVIVGGSGERELVLLDPTTHAAIAPPHALGAGFEPVHAWCADDRCAVVGITDEGGGPARRLVVIRVRADGTHEQELVAPGWIGLPHAAARGDHVIVSWKDDDGLAVRALDRRGHPLGPAIPVPWDSNRRIRGDTLLHADGAVMLAVGELGRWSVAAFGQDATPGPFRELPGATGFLLVGAPQGEGLAWINVDGDVSYDEMGPGVMTHFWRSRAVAGFLPASGAPTQVELASGAGGGRGGFEPLMLVRPGAAAALVVPRDDAADFSTSVLVRLRLPCPG